MRTRSLGCVALATLVAACVARHGEQLASQETSPDGGAPPDASPDAVTALDAAPDADAAIDSGTPCGVGQARLCERWERCSSSADCAAGLCSKVTFQCVSNSSCQGGKGADDRCGDGHQDCCQQLAVPGGSFVNYDVNGPTGNVEQATVSGFKLDRYEVTVGRVRAFLATFQSKLRSSAPAVGAGAHPLIPGSGWRQSFDARLPNSVEEAFGRMSVACSIGGGSTNYGASTWTDQVGPNEDKPINCVDWYTMFMFCAWDNGRLPTDAEWSLAAVGGDEQRVYPYGNADPTWSGMNGLVVSQLNDPATPNDFRFTFGPMYRSADDGSDPIAPVGLKSETTRWGHSDMTGNVIEFTLDAVRSLPATCENCANVAWPDPPQDEPGPPPTWQVLTLADGGETAEFGPERAVKDGIRFARGSSWQGEPGGHHLKNGPNRFWLPVWRTYSAVGARCAHDL